MLDRAIGNSPPHPCPDLDQGPPHPDELRIQKQKYLEELKKVSPAGGHYRKHGAVQPIDLIEDMSLGFHEGNIIKYVARWKDKNGVEDLKKARWYLDRLIVLNDSNNGLD